MIGRRRSQVQRSIVAPTFSIKRLFGGRTFFILTWACAIVVSAFPGSSAAQDPKDAAAQEYKNNVLFVKILPKSGTNPDREGSGVLVHKQGFIITAKHVVEDITDGQELKVSLTRNGFAFPAKIFECAANKNVDLCIIKADPTDVSSISRYPDLSCRIASESETIRAMGYPIGGGSTLSLQGRVSAGADNNFLIPVQLGTVPGMSGGPVLDTQSRVVGIIKGAANGLPQFQFFTPLQYAQSSLSNAGLSCSSDIQVCGVIMKSISDRLVSTNTVEPRRESREVRIQASPGCRIQGASFSSGAMKHVYDPSIEIDKDATNINFSYQLESGPFTNPYSAEMNTTLTIKQIYR